jgi:lysophospholipase L1-like esterase
MSSLNSAEIPGKPTDPAIRYSEIVPQWPPLNGKVFSGAIPENPNICNIDLSSPVQLTLPKIIYGVVDMETRIFYHNLVYCENKAALKFDVDCVIGNSYDNFFSFNVGVPGKYPCKITVFQNGKIVGISETLILVAPKDSGVENNAVILTIGDSILADGDIVRLHDNLLKSSGHNFIRMMGSHSGLGKQLSANDIAVEAYGGWKWQCFATRYSNENNYNSKSKFIKINNNQTTFILQEYLDKYNNNFPPDVVIFSLGCNDIALAKQDTLSKVIADSFAARKKLILEFQKVMPNAIIGIVLIMPPNILDEAFEINYHGEITRNQYTCNQFNYVKSTLLELQDCPNISLIPVYTAIDENTAYPVDNALHPNQIGKQQFAQTLFSWLKNIMSH